MSNSLSKDGQKNLPWIEKYRPESLEDLISHRDILSILSRFIIEGRFPHLLFYGPPGTGKTSTILACARKMYGDSWRTMVLELNASDDRGIDVVREQIKEFSSTRSMNQSGFKMIVLDEADSMTGAAQAALRRVIENFTSNVRFCLICNYVGKIIPALQSRCTRFRFGPLSDGEMEPKLRSIAETEKLVVDNDGIQAILRLSQGDMRKSLNIMQSTAASYQSHITELSVHSCTGDPLPSDIEKMVTCMMNNPYTIAYTNVLELKNSKGLAFSDIIREVHRFIQQVNFPVKARLFLLEKLAELEYRMAQGCHEKLQLSALVGAFQLAADNMV